MQENLSRSVLFRRLALLVISLFLFSIPVKSYAKERRITDVSVSISGAVKVGDVVNYEKLSVTAGGGGYSYDFYTMNNTKEYWSAGDKPVMKVNLSPADGFLFATKVSGMTINVYGAEFKKAEIINKGGALVVTVELPPLTDSVGPVRTITVENRVCSWTTADGAGSYEARLLYSGADQKGGKRLGDVQNASAKAMSYDGTHYMTREGYYHYEVRGLLKSDSSISGEWTESEYIYVSREQAETQKVQNDAAQNAGVWEQSGKKEDPTWKYRLEDGTYATGWQEINYKTYYFSNKGVMTKGWKEIGKKWHYFDSTDGYLWKSAITPDGYYVDFDGIWQDGVAE